MQVSVRKAGARDLESLLPLLRELDTAGDAGLTPEQGASILERMASYPNYAVYVAEDPDHRIVGCFALLVMDNLAHGGAPSAIIEDVVVDRDLRGRGIGRAMMGHAMSLAARAGCYKLVLSSNRSRTDAHDFYRSLGFTEHGVSFAVQLAR